MQILPLKTVLALSSCLLLIATPSVGQSQDRSIAGLSEEIRELTATVTPAVVQIYTSSFGALVGSIPEGAAVFGDQQATGSGVIVDSSGYIITNNHVIQGAKRVQVRLSPQLQGKSAGNSILAGSGTLVGAQIVGVDKETDLAVLKIDGTDLPHLALGNSDDLHQGQLVFAFGSPMGLTNSVSFGVVSTVARQLERDHPMIYIQTDVAINPGNSGGPLVNGAGEVIGINTLIFSQSGGSEGLSFSAPSNIVKNVYDQIRKTGRVRRGVIGVHAQSVNPWLSRALRLNRDWGVILGDVFATGPAAAANLRVGDVVLAMDGKPMENARQFEVNLYNKTVGGKVKLAVQRGDRTFDVEVKVAERVEPDYRFFDLINAEQNLVHRLGILSINLDQKTASMLPFQPRADKGVVVAALAVDESVFGERFQPGDVLYTLNGQTIQGLRSLKELVRAVPVGEPVAFQLERGGVLRYLVMELD